MKFIVAFAVLIAAASALSPTLLASLGGGSHSGGSGHSGDITVLKNAFTSELGGYNYEFEQSDGQKRTESGVVKNVGAEDEHIAVTGSFSFTAEDGQTYTVTYVADENGFQPSGAHLPVAPVV